MSSTNYQPLPQTPFPRKPSLKLYRDLPKRKRRTKLTLTHFIVMEQQEWLPATANPSPHNGKRKLFTFPVLNSARCIRTQPVAECSEERIVAQKSVPLTNVNSLESHSSVDHFEMDEQEHFDEHKQKRFRGCEYNPQQQQHQDKVFQLFRNGNFEKQSLINMTSEIIFKKLSYEIDDSKLEMLNPIKDLSHSYNSDPIIPYKSRNSL